MSAAALIAELAEAGSRVRLDGSGLVADVLPGAELDAYRERIARYKPAILRELLQREVLEAAAAVGDAFDRVAYDALWARWYALRDQQHTQAPAEVDVCRSPVTASTPPAGWDGGLCDGCPWPLLCGVLGPRGPHLPGGSCTAWPSETATEVSA